MLTTELSHIAEIDAEVWPIMQAEEERQRNTLELIASENHVSPAVREAVGSVFTNKYAEGYPGRRYYGGCVNMDGVEDFGPRAGRRSCFTAITRMFSRTRAVRPTPRSIWPSSSRVIPCCRSIWPTAGTCRTD